MALGAERLENGTEERLGGENPLRADEPVDLDEDREERGEVYAAEKAEEEPAAQELRGAFADLTSPYSEGSK